jgi:hypothetical protein
MKLKGKHGLDNKGSKVLSFFLSFKKKVEIVQKWKTFCALRTFFKKPSPLHFGTHIVLARFVNPHKVFV